MKRLRWLLGVTALVLLAASALTACTVSLGGGIAGIIGGLLLGALTVLGLGSTTAGCKSCDSPIGPCLSVTRPRSRRDAGTPAKPKPKPAARDAMAQKTPEPPVRPCLSVAPPQPPPKKPAVGPCLSVLPPKKSHQKKPGHPPKSEQTDPRQQLSPAEERARILAKLGARLPSDVRDRLE